VQDALSTLMEGRTSLVIAHRLSTIRKADKILVLQQGQIEEEGTHQVLMDKKGVYANLVSLQLLDV
jgi:subfamily B ATP-binding cassette protein MsbA